MLFYLNTKVKHKNTKVKHKNTKVKHKNTKVNNQKKTQKNLKNKQINKKKIQNTKVGVILARLFITVQNNHIFMNLTVMKCLPEVATSLLLNG